MSGAIWIDWQSKAGPLQSDSQLLMLAIGTRNVICMVGKELELV